MQDFDLRKLNSATKYPSIPTFHELGPGGILQESGNPFKDHDGPIYVTEKVDGANGRIICYDDDWFIGSREDLLTASGDRIPNPVQRIVETLEPRANLWVDTEYKLYVYYFEVYGDKRQPAWKTYGNGTATAALMFDQAEIPLEVLTWDIEQIASWRDQGGQNFNPRVTFAHFDTVPLLSVLDNGNQVPESIEDMYQFLQIVAKSTEAGIDPDTQDRPEGIVLRTADRSIIRKVRYQNYERTLQQREQRQR